MKTPGKEAPEGDHAEERRRQFEESRGLGERRELVLDEKEAADEPSSETRRRCDDEPDEDTDDQDTEDENADEQESEEGGP